MGPTSWSIDTVLEAGTYQNIYVLMVQVYVNRADSTFAPSQWETSWQNNDVSHWLCANLESDLCKQRVAFQIMDSPNRYRSGRGFNSIWLFNALIRQDDVKKEYSISHLGTYWPCWQLTYFRKYRNIFIFLQRVNAERTQIVDPRWCELFFFCV